MQREPVQRESVLPESVPQKSVPQKSVPQKSVHQKSVPQKSVLGEPWLQGSVGEAVPHLLLVASTGGHLAQLVALRPWWEQYARTWVTFDKADARSTLQGETVVPAFHPTTRNLPNAVRNLGVAARLLPRLRPSLVVSTGAGLAVPFFAAAKALGIPSVYLEVYDRVDSRTMTGRMCRPLASAFCVQWPDQLDLYPGSELVGTLL